jgi:hypothetical protein
VEDVLCADYSFPSIGENNEVRFLLPCKTAQQDLHVSGFSTLPRVTSYMMSCANDTIHLLVASDISTFKFEIGRADWSSVRTQEIQLYSKFGVINSSYPKGQIIEAALEFMKQSKSKDLEWSDLPTEDVEVDGIPEISAFTYLPLSMLLNHLFQFRKQKYQKICQILLIPHHLI